MVPSSNMAQFQMLFLSETEMGGSDYNQTKNTEKTPILKKKNLFQILQSLTLIIFIYE